MMEKIKRQIELLHNSSERLLQASQMGDRTLWLWFIRKEAWIQLKRALGLWWMTRGMRGGSVSKKRIISDVFPTADCKWYDCCTCTITKPKKCSECTFYCPIDSGYGWCKALPTFEVVAWCRDVCSLFKRPDGVKKR